MTGKRPTRSEVRNEIKDLRTEAGGDPDGPPSVTIEHVHVELPDDEKVDPDDPPAPGDAGDGTPEVRGVTRRIEAERDHAGDWAGGTVFAADGGVDLPADAVDNDGGGE